MSAPCTTVGVVLTEANVEEFKRTVLFAHGLGVADIRIISAAQWNAPLEDLDLPSEVLDVHPILAYRVANLRSNVTVRGLGPEDSDRCPLVLDDMAVLRGEHYPCIIYLREQGAPIGRVGPGMRAERASWAKDHDVKKDPICAGNCLDVCRDYNRKACLSKTS